MPLSAVVPAVLGVASLVSGNSQQKAADKNNQNQQTAELANAQNAAQQAQNMYNSYATANPAPFAGATVAKPTAGAYSTSPSQTGVIQRILQAAGAQQQPPANMASAPAMARPQPMAQPGIVNAILGS